MDFAKFGRPLTLHVSVTSGFGMATCFVQPIEQRGARRKYGQSTDGSEAGAIFP